MDDIMDMESQSLRGPHRLKSSQSVKYPPKEHWTPLIMTAVVCKDTGNHHIPFTNGVISDDETMSGVVTNRFNTTPPEARIGHPAGDATAEVVWNIDVISRTARDGVETDYVNLPVTRKTSRKWHKHNILPNKFIMKARMSVVLDLYITIYVTISTVRNFILGFYC